MLCALLAIGVTGCSGTASEGPPPAPEILQAIKARQSNYKEIGGAFKSIGDELKSAVPDFNSVGPAAREILTRAQNQLQFFPTGSGPESHVKTRAKPAIWADFTAFTQAHEKFVSSAQQLSDALVSGADRTALSQRAATLGESCKACHDRFRVPD
jgi:cytochrome c556